MDSVTTEIIDAIYLSLNANIVMELSSTLGHDRLSFLSYFKDEFQASQMPPKNHSLATIRALHPMNSLAKSPKSLFNQNGKEIISPVKVVVKSFDLGKEKPVSTVINPLFGYSESAAQKRKMKEQYMADTKKDLIRLALSDSPVIARKKAYATDIKKETPRQDETPLINEKHKKQIEYMEQLERQIQLQEEYKRKQKEQAKVRVIKETASVNSPSGIKTALEQYKEEIKKQYDDFTRSKKEKKTKRMEELKKEEERLEKERNEIAERYEAQTLKEKRKEERIKAVRDQIREECLKKQQEELNKRTKKFKKESPVVPKKFESEELTPPKDPPMDSCARLKEELGRKETGIQQFIANLKERQKETIMKGTKALKRLEEIKFLITKPLNIEPRREYEEGSSRSSTSQESNGLLQSSRFVKPNFYGV